MLFPKPGRATHALFLIVCMLAVPVYAGAAQPVAPKDALFAAKALLEQEKLDEAEAIYAVLRANPSEEIRTEAVFQLAHIRVRQGKFRQAISLFHEILNRRPDLVRVRLDLARAYFLDKNYEDATFQFELVKGGDLPPEVLTNVDAFLDAIRRQKNWTVDFSLSPVSDSNINQASGGREECLDFFFGPMTGTMCRPLEEKASGIGLNANASVDYFRRFSQGWQDWGLRATLGFYGMAFEQKEYDDFILSTALGPRYLWESGEASVQPTIRKRWIGTKEYSEDYGCRLDARQIFGRVLLSAGAAWYDSRYADAYVNSVLKGQSFSAYMQPRFILTDRTFVQAGLDFLREDTKVRSYANDNWRYALGAYHAFAYGMSLFVEGSLMRTRYNASQWYVTRDNAITETTRQDTTWQFAASLSSSVFERYDLTPVLQYVYTKRDSNIWTRDYDRHRINFLINYRF
jgi:tetratricopeptide (TPR) repeat protein